MEKVIRNNEVAVLISEGFGAGWYSWNSDHEQLLFHPKIVEMVESGRQSEIDEDWVKKNLLIENVFCGGAEDLIIEWIPLGTRFIVDEYDGSECLVVENDMDIKIA